jgi:AraC-like DNA-binding protein
MPRIRWTNGFRLFDAQINAEGVHSWPFNHVLPVEVVFHTFDWHHTIRSNRHDCFELIYLHSGHAHCQIQDHVFLLEAGDLVVIDSTVYHRLTARSSGKIQVVSLLFLPELVSAHEASMDTAEYLKPFFHHRPDFPYVVHGRTGIPAEVYRLMKLMHHHLPASSDIARLYVRTCVKMILVLLGSHYEEFLKGEESFNYRQRAIQRLRPVFEFIEVHYPEKIRLEDVASRVYISKTQFKRLFKQVTGQSFVFFLKQFRIEKAQTLLRGTDHSVSQVAYETGYCTQSYFGSEFRRTVGITPLAYRRHYGNSTPGGQPPQHDGQ